MSRPGAGRRTVRGAARRVGLAAAGALMAMAAVAALPADGLGQEGGGDDEAPEEEGLLVETPQQYRLSATGSALLWEEARTRSPDDGALWGAEIERLVLQYGFARLGTAFGPSTVVTGDRSAEVNTFVIELFVGPRFAFPALRRAGVVPYLGVGAGSLVHQPTDDDDLTTRNQNAFLWGGGVEWSFHPRWGVRGEWRRYSADLENLFAELDRTGESRDADRIQISVFWAF